MSNVQNTIGMGLSKLQDGIDKSKSKVDLMKEVSKMNKNIEDISAKKADLLLEIGLMCYQKVREGTLEDYEIKEKCKSITGFDYLIYYNKMKIDEISNINKGFLCECGNSVSQEDKFCGSCGKKIEEKIEECNYIVCNNCEMSIIENAKFCPCCGMKISRA